MRVVEVLLAGRGTLSVYGTVLEVVRAAALDAETSSPLSSRLAEVVGLD